MATDNAAIIATWDYGSLPRLCFENNSANAAAPVACPGFVPHGGRSYIWGNIPHSIYCPPYHFSFDSYFDIIMDAGFDCEVSTSTEETSWGGIKDLFR